MKSSHRFVTAEFGLLLTALVVTTPACAQTAASGVPPVQMMAPPGQVIAPPNAPAAMVSGKPSLPLGEALYQSCANCHGKTGVGDGPNAASLNPKPTPFKGITLDRIQKAVVVGVNSNTPGHKIANLMSPDEVKTLIDYVDRLSK